MAGGPPDAFRSYMKQGDDGRWYWDDGNDPSKIAEGVKSAGEDGSAPWRQAGAAFSYGLSDGMMAAAGADKVERAKAPAAPGVDKANTPFAMPQKTVTAVEPPSAGPVSQTAAAASAVPATPSGDDQLYNDMMAAKAAPKGKPGEVVVSSDGNPYVVQPDGTMKPVPGEQAPAGVWSKPGAAPAFNPIMEAGTAGWTAGPGAMVDAKGNTSTAHARPDAVVSKNNPLRKDAQKSSEFGPAGKPVAAPSGFNPMAEYGTESRPAALAPMPSNAVSAADMREVSGELFANRWTPPGSGAKGMYAGIGAPVSPNDLRRAPDEFRVTPDEQLYHDMMNAPRQAYQKVATAPLIPSWGTGGPAAPASGPGGKLPVDASPTGPQPQITASSPLPYQKQKVVPAPAKPPAIPKKAAPAASKPTPKLALPISMKGF